VLKLRKKEGVCVRDANFSLLNKVYLCSQSVGNVEAEIVGGSLGGETVAVVGLVDGHLQILVDFVIELRLGRDVLCELKSEEHR